MDRANVPAISVVVPTYNRPEGLGRCLAALAAQDYPRERFEVVVVDDGGAIPARSTAEPFLDTAPLRLVRQENSGPSAARNAGAAAASGDFVAFTDDDCAPEPGWLSGFAEVFGADAKCAAGGRTVNGRPDDVYATASELLVTFLYDYHVRGSSRGPFIPSNNVAFPLAAFRELGGFDTTFRRPGAEDRELCRRWVDRGYRLAEAGRAVVRHYHPLSLSTFVEQHFRYGRGAVLLHQSGRWTRARSESLSFYARLVTFPFRSEPMPAAMRLSALMLVTQAAHTAGFIWEATKNRTSPRAT